MANWTSVMARLGMPTGDNRIIVPNALTNRDLPLPLLWQRASSEGHGGSVVVGRIESIDYAPDMVTATGTMLDVPEAAEAQTLIEAGVIGPSVDLDDMTYIVDDNEQMIITEARVAGATLVPIPAFAEVSITMSDGAGPVAAPDAQDGVDETPPTSTPSIIAAASVVPSFGWFANPQLAGPTSLTVTEDGRVFGHIAPWNVCHVGLPDCKTAPSSPSGYAYFLTHEQQTDGGLIPVGVLSVGGGHAAPGGFQPAIQHYDDVAAAVAHINVGEDEHGIWASGWILPYADPVKVEQFKTSPLSGDWRRIGGAMELIAACSVNTPGFPIPRARVSFALGQPQSLVMALSTPVSGEMPAPVEEPAKNDAQLAQAKWAWTNRKGR